jgi:hypothetical protein
MWNLVLVRLETVLVSVQDSYTVCAERTIGSGIVYDTQWNSEVTWIMRNLVMVRLEIVLVSVQHRCTVCA